MHVIGSKLPGNVRDGPQVEHLSVPFTYVGLQWAQLAAFLWGPKSHAHYQEVVFLSACVICRRVLMAPVEAPP